MLCLTLATLPMGRAEAAFSLYFNSESESVFSYEACRLKKTQTVSYDCGSNLGTKLVIYASPSGACTNTPGSDAIILLSERTLNTSSDCKGTLSIDPSVVIKDGSCPCNTQSTALRICAATKYQAYNYETLLIEWIEDETVSLDISYDSKPPTAPTLTKIGSGDESLYLNFTGPSDITEWIACVVPVEPSEDEDTSDEVTLEVSALIRNVVMSAITKADDTESTEDTCEVERSPFEDCEKTATFSGAGTTHGVVRGLVNDQTYRVTLAGRDLAGNYSPISEPLEGTPMDVQDFFEIYVEAGGSEEGGFSCSSAGGTPFLGAVGLALAIGTLLRRRWRHARASKSLCVQEKSE